METEEDNYYDIEKWLCLDKELSYCLNIAKENGTIGYPIQYCPICGKKLK